MTGAHRIVRFAFEYARAHRRHRITVGHKANVMRFSDGIFLEAAQEDAPDFPDIAMDEIQIDHLSARLARSPERFDVLLLPNLYGDIISDLCAGLVGGLGLIPGANIGWEYAVFEAVHGSAPDIAGQQKANPVAMILSGAMMLRHLGELDAAENVEWGVDETLRKGAGAHTRPGRHRHHHGVRRGHRRRGRSLGARAELGGQACEPSRT